jgi:hypothetical protein
MLLKQIFIVKFILISKYLPAIVESRLPPRSSPNIFILFIGIRVNSGYYLVSVVPYCVTVMTDKQDGISDRKF